jgi:hypothetical protein
MHIYRDKDLSKERIIELNLIEIVPREGGINHTDTRAFFVIFFLVNLIFGNSKFDR